MKYTYVGKNIEITQGLKNHVEEKLSRLGNYFDAEKEAKVVMSVQKNNHKVEATVYINNLIIRAEEVSDDMYTAIDLLVDKLERKIRKQKTKIKKVCHENIKGSFNIEEPVFEEDCSSSIVKRKVISSKPMTEEEAMLQLELLNHDFFVYTNTDGIVSVLYKRKNENYGIIEVV